MYLYSTKKEKGIQYRILFSRNKYCQICESAVLMTIYIIAHIQSIAILCYSFCNSHALSCTKTLYLKHILMSCYCEILLFIAIKISLVSYFLFYDNKKRDGLYMPVLRKHLNLHF